ncbi:hypothetical protein PAAG_11744 [Paracoccidioides lutzii Pb01]|uniref:Uncharacterized protein n=1 Tax=Paracoccidioides lutzii (strain ATCC MYA-826 / Pb01) TaxID=502779 RepID=A0A0A2VKU5_PARBA|nr:hypothetical protein PAAG_11744 [Paracoccidioides lutzii Pb01]KGQ01509.1 hypothetical protein PAAG_11744 [Paracoccidioides lutzii Pb01]
MSYEGSGRLKRNEGEYEHTSDRHVVYSRLTPEAKVLDLDQVIFVASRILEFTRDKPVNNDLAMFSSRIENRVNMSGWFRYLGIQNTAYGLHPAPRNSYILGTDSLQPKKGCTRVARRYCSDDSRKHRMNILNLTMLMP